MWQRNKFLSIALITLFCVNIAKPTLGQQTKLSDTISIEIEKLQIKQILDSLSTNYNYYFSYNPEQFCVTQKISTNAKKIQLQQLVTLIAHGQHMSFTLKNRHIIFKPPKTKNTSHSITGTITENEIPIPNVSVYLKNSMRGVITNQDGFFALKYHKEFIADTLLISHLGYKTQHLPVGSLKYEPLNIQLEKHNISLDEIIVTATTANNIIKETIENIPKTYPHHAVCYTSFYREEVTKNNNYQYFSEAILKIFKNSYAGIFNQEHITREQSRTFHKANNDTLLLKIKAGLRTALLLDIVRYQPDFLHTKTFTNYIFELIEPTYQNNELIFKVRFIPRPGSEANYTGILLIDAKRKALAGVTFEYAENRTHKLHDLINKNTTIIPTGAKYTIRYRLKKDTYYLHFITTQLDFTINNKCESELQRYRTKSSLYVVNTDTLNVEKPTIKERINPQIIFSKRHFHYEPDFWGKYDYHMPSNQVIEDLQRMFNTESTVELTK
jgi:hypothetical protein